MDRESVASTSFSQDLRERLEVERQVGRTVSLDVSTYACQIYRAPSDDESEGPGRLGRESVVSTSLRQDVSYSIMI